MNEIHNTAIIGKNSIIGSNVKIGPYCVIEDGVKIGNDNILYPNVYMSGETDIGQGNIFFPFWTSILPHQKTFLYRRGKSPKKSSRLLSMLLLVMHFMYGQGNRIPSRQSPEVRIRS